MPHSQRVRMVPRRTVCPRRPCGRAGGAGAPGSDPSVAGRGIVRPM